MVQCMAIRPRWPRKSLGELTVQGVKKHHRLQPFVCRHFECHPRHFQIRHADRGFSDLQRRTLPEVVPAAKNQRTLHSLPEIRLFRLLYLGWSSGTPAGRIRPENEMGGHLPADRNETGIRRSGGTMLHGTCQSHCRKNPVENPDSSAINRDVPSLAPSLFSFYLFLSLATAAQAPISSPLRPPF